jgi:hypothetical protein
MKKLLVVLIGLFLSVNCFAQWNMSVSFSGAWGSRAFQVGRDTNGNPLYLCHGDIQSSTQPGKTWPNYNKCNVPFAGREVLLSNFQVYHGHPRGHWQRSGDYLPHAAMVVGHDVNGNTLYLCRAHYDGSVQPGKTWRGYGRCNIPYGGREIIMNDYEVYVLGWHHWYPPHHRYHPRVPRQCVSGPFGARACGYHCLTTAATVRCAQSPSQECVSDTFGHIACGYHCARTPSGVQCASRYENNCIANAFGQIRCGYRCRVNNFNQIHCG